MTEPASHYGITAIIHGSSKVGKSWCGDTTPAPRLVLDAEAGSRFTPSRKRLWNPINEKPPEPDGSWDTALVTVHDFRTVLKAYEWLASGAHPFRSVVVDSISEVQQRCVDDIAGVKAMQTQDWGQLLRIVSDLVRKFRDLTVNPIKPMDAVIFIAMTRERDGIYAPHIQGSLSTVLPYYVDICGYMAPTTHQDTGETVRRLFVGSFTGFITGERVGGCLGQYIDSPDVSKMLGEIRGYLNGGSDDR